MHKQVIRSGKKFASEFSPNPNSNVENSPSLTLKQMESYDRVNSESNDEFE